jgi:hypothetical protein
MDWLEERAREVSASIADIRRLAGLSQTQISWRPPDGGWSISQVLEHLILTDSAYLPVLHRAIANGPRGETAWRPSLMGGLLLRFVRPKSKRKVKAIKGYIPGPEPRANVVSDYIALREQLLRAINQARSRDLRRTRFISPLSSLFRMNLGDAIMVLVVHTQRHLEQIARVRANASFPHS